MDHESLVMTRFGRHIQTNTVRMLTFQTFYLNRQDTTRQQRQDPVDNALQW